MPNEIDAIRQALARSDPVVVAPDGKVSASPVALGTKARALHWFNWWESPHGSRRLVDENAEVSAQFPGFRLRQLDGKLVWHGSLRSNFGYDYEIVVTYPENFPEAPAKVKPLIDVKRVHDIHLYDTGEICFAPPDARLQDRMTVAGLLALTGIWIYNYEQICVGAGWAGPVASSGGR